jgi:hypothetical protein
MLVALPLINTGISLAVVFDMVTKPAGIPVALSVVVIGAALGAAKGMRRPAVAVRDYRSSSRTRGITVRP